MEIFVFINDVLQTGFVGKFYYEYSIVKDKRKYICLYFTYFSRSENWEYDFALNLYLI